MTLKNLLILVKTDKPILIRYGGMEPAKLTPEVMARMGDKTIRSIDITPMNDMIVELEDAMIQLPTNFAACHC